MARIVGRFAAQGVPAPTPGELGRRIERHLAARGRAIPPATAAPDAARSLHDALAALRHSRS